MKTFYSKVVILFIAGVILSACGTSNDVVSGHIISKRKVNKGFFINHSKKMKADDQSATEARKPFIQYEEQEEVLAVVEENTVSNESEPAEVSQINTGSEIIAPFESDFVTDNKSTKVSDFDSDKNVEVEQVASAEPQSEFRPAKKNQANKTSRDVGAETILLVILCFILSPLAVFLHEGTWNTACWINLILFLLFIIPGIIHGLIVILT